jgi:NTP pyrophosphatase (non-canonical NTP hydrolase)
MRWTQKEITKWAVSTFGEPESVGRIIARGVEEAEEALLAFHDGVPGSKVVEELADAYIVLCQAAHHLGYNLLEEVERKMEVNKNRVWNLNGDGTAQHV